MKNHADQQPSRAKRLKRTLRAKIKEHPRLKNAVVAALFFVGKPMKRAGQFLTKEAYKLAAPGTTLVPAPTSPDGFRLPSRYYVLEKEGAYVVYRGEKERDKQARGHGRVTISTCDSYADFWMGANSVEPLVAHAGGGGTVHAYTDGSQCETTKSYAWAVHFVTSDGAVQFSGTIVDTGKDSSGSFSAELTAALMAARIAREAGFSKVVIHHDLAGVNVSDKGVGNSKKADMVSYRLEMAEEMKRIRVQFKKCASNSKSNPAHKLAHQAAKHAKRTIA